MLTPRLGSPIINERILMGITGEYGAALLSRVGGGTGPMKPGNLLALSEKGANSCKTVNPF
jgi:hypothetical protein